ncbi:MAG: sugar phosphate isomerase/epimerase [Isosphaeraceae bacterium]
MTLAISNIAWDPAEDDEIGRILREKGVSSVEIAPTKYWPAPALPVGDQVAELRKRWADRGQKIVALQSLLFGRPELSIFGDNAATAEFLARILAIAADLGAGPLVFGSPRNRDRGERDLPRAIDEAAAFFRPLARRAHDLGVVIGFEPNPTAYACNFATTVAEALAVVEAVDHPGFGLHLDIGIMHMNGEDPVEAVRKARPRMVHAHISEPRLAAVPAGEVDHQAAASALRQAGWNGTLSIEMRGDTDGQNPARVQRAIQFCKEVYG